MMYGVSSVFNFGKWNHSVYTFDDEKTAQKWLNTEEYNFSERELMDESKAIKLAGKKAVKNAVKVTMKKDENGIEYIEKEC